MYDPIPEIAANCATGFIESGVAFSDVNRLSQKSVSLVPSSATASGVMPLFFVPYLSFASSHISRISSIVGALASLKENRISGLSVGLFGTIT